MERSSRKRHIPIHSDYLLTYKPKTRRGIYNQVETPDSKLFPTKQDNSNPENEEKEIAALAIIELFQQPSVTKSVPPSASRKRDKTWTKTSTRVANRKEKRMMEGLKPTTKCEPGIHHSIILSLGDLQRRLQVCDIVTKNDCRCGLYHCPLCEVDFYKPVQYRSLLTKHLVTHEKYSIKYGEYICCLCRLNCGACLQSHYHCPVCYERLSKRLAFIGHLEKHESSSEARGYTIQTRVPKRRPIQLSVPRDLAVDRMLTGSELSCSEVETETVRSAVETSVDVECLRLSEVDSRVVYERESSYVVPDSSSTEAAGHENEIHEVSTDNNNQLQRHANVVDAINEIAVVAPAEVNTIGSRHGDLVYYRMSTSGQLVAADVSVHNADGLEETIVEIKSEPHEEHGQVFQSLVTQNCLLTNEQIAAHDRSMSRGAETSPSVRRSPRKQVLAVRSPVIVEETSNEESAPEKRASTANEPVVNYSNEEVINVRYLNEDESMTTQQFQVLKLPPQIIVVTRASDHDKVEHHDQVQQVSRSLEAQKEAISVADSISLPDTIMNEDSDGGESDQECNVKEKSQSVLVQVDAGGSRLGDLSELERFALENYLLDEKSESFKIVEKVNEKGLIEFPCQQCHVIKQSKDAIYRHYRRDHSEKRFMCTRCPRRYAQFTDLKQHLERCKGDKLRFESNECPICVKVFVNKRSLSRHYKAFHKKTNNADEPADTFECTACDKTFAQKRYLRSHIVRFHEAEKRFSCEVCHKSFKMDYHLKEHLKIHDKSTVDSRWMCRVCGKGFSRVQTWEDHLNTHEAKKPHSCDQCDKSFASRFSLTKHRAVMHSTRYPHTCRLCDHGFAYKHQLKRHMTMYHQQHLINANRTPSVATNNNNEMTVEVQSCVLCGLAFPDAEAMKKHFSKGENEFPDCCVVDDLEPALENQNENDVFQCSVCMLVFDQWSEIAVHMAEHNGNSTDDPDENVDGENQSADAENKNTGQAIEAELVGEDTCDGEAVAAIVEAATTDPDSFSEILDISQFLKQISPKKRVDTSRSEGESGSGESVPNVAMTSLLKNFRPLS